MDSSDRLMRNFEFSIAAKRQLLEDAEILSMFSRAVDTVIE